RLAEKGANEALNRRISLLVLNKQSEDAIVHENAESENESLSVLQQPGAVPPASNPTPSQPVTR
ncbi:flagellar motor protein MotB, partial [Cronobacter sakazakii]